MNFIFGVAGFAREVDFLIANQCRQGRTEHKTDAFVAEDANALVGTELKGVPVISESEFFSRHARELANCFVAVGSPAIKRRIVDRLRREADVRFPALIDPSVVYDTRPGGIAFGEGCIVCAMNVLTTDIEIGPFAHLNLDCTVGHDTRVGAFSTVSPGVHLSGNVTLEQEVFIGTGAIVLERLSICTGAVIGGGAAVVSNIEAAGIYVGTPAKRLVRSS